MYLELFIIALHPLSHNSFPFYIVSYLHPKCISLNFGKYFMFLLITSVELAVIPHP